MGARKHENHHIFVGIIKLSCNPNTPVLGGNLELKFWDFVKISTRKILNLTNSLQFYDFENGLDIPLKKNDPQLLGWCCLLVIFMGCRPDNNIFNTISCSCEHRNVFLVRHNVQIFGPYVHGLVGSVFFHTHDTGDVPVMHVFDLKHH